MRTINFSVLILVIVICFTSAQQSLTIALPPTDPRICKASEKLPGPCILLYKPVCGVYLNSLGNQVKQTFSNRCFACKHSKVKYVYEGACSSYPSNSKFCIPLPPNVSILCANVNAPVCGWFSKNVSCFVWPCAINAKNACLACLNKNVDYYIAGKCPSLGFLSKKP